LTTKCPLGDALPGQSHGWYWENKAQHKKHETQCTSAKEHMYVHTYVYAIVVSLPVGLFNISWINLHEIVKTG